MKLKLTHADFYFTDESNEENIFLVKWTYLSIVSLFEIKIYKHNGGDNPFRHPSNWEFLGATKKVDYMPTINNSLDFLLKRV